MQMHRWTYGPGFLATAVAAVVALPAAAQGRALFEWSGRVDREVQLVMRGDDLSARFAGGEETGRDRARVLSELPRETGQVRVRVERGRGVVDVIQQPTYRNGYTAVVRIRDGTSGADHYRLAAYWMSESNGTWDGGWGRERDEDGRWERGRDRGRDRDDDRWDRDDDRRGDGRWGRRGRGGALRWSGSVDEVVQVRIRGQHVETVTLRGEGTRSVRSSMTGRGPSGPGATLEVRQVQGRGRVTVVQQPSSRNGYTAVIEIRDPRSGYGYYDLDVVW